MNMFLLSKVLQYLAQDETFTDGITTTDSQQLVVKVQVQDRMIQPTVDVNCSSVLWGNLHAPKDVAKVLEKLWENGVTGSPMLKPVLAGNDNDDQFSIESLLEAAKPPVDSPVSDAPEGMNAKLHKYQKRALAWMLFKEQPQPGCKSNGRLHPHWRAYRLPSKTEGV